jgi:N-acetylmuramoyl-L-alanine amidase
LMPAILIEGGYMTNPTEGRKIYDATYRQQMASAIVKGILNYARLAGPGGGTPAGHPARRTSRIAAEDSGGSHE